MSLRTASAAPLISGCLSIVGSLTLYFCVASLPGKRPCDRATVFENAIVDPEDPIRLVAMDTDFRIRMGDRLNLEIGLCNTGDRTVYFPPDRYFMQHAWCGAADHPSCVVEIVDAEGRIQDFFGPPLHDAPDRPLQASDFRPLKPGNYLPLHHPMESWRPPAPGRYTVRIALDTRGEIPDAWECGAGPADDSAMKGLERMPRRRFVSNALKIIVEPE